MCESGETLRVALLAGTLGRGGSEKQIVHVAGALREHGACVHVYCLTQGESYEGALVNHGIPVHWFGQVRNPVIRLWRLFRMLQSFAPHVVQSMHSFMNLYAWPSARAVGALSVGALRSDLQFCIDSYGRGAKWLLWLPDALVANSDKAARETVRNGIVASSRVYVLPNCIEAKNYRPSPELGHSETRDAVFLARLLPSKRPDLFLEALSLARQEMPALKGTVLGDGPELERMQRLACDLGLVPAGVRFTGHCADPVPWLSESSMMVFCSDSEGSPNVILEALASELPVITTPAGDAAAIIQSSESGYVVPFNDPGAIAEKMVLLARSVELRRVLGRAGRAYVETAYSPEELGVKLFTIYHAAATENRNRSVLGVLRSLELRVAHGADGR